MNQLNKLIKLLEYRLNGPLPGKKAHFKMIPSLRLREFDPIPENARRSSVILLLFEQNKTIFTLLTLRPTYKGVHSSQVSFPGGSFSEPDKNLTDTALRETEEEIGLDRSKIKIIGSLSELYIPPSNFLVKPFVGFTEDIGILKPDAKEVEKIFTIELKELLGDRNIKTKKIRIQSGTEFDTPYYDVCGLTVWGATAMILREFSEICREISL